MEKIEIFDMFSDSVVQNWKYQIMQGLLFILFGLIILLFPQLLVAMVASFFVIIGIMLMTSAWGLRRLTKRYNGFRSDIFDLF